MDHDDVVALLEAILTDIPRLDGATCRGRHELFDPIRGKRSPIPARGTDTASEGRPDLRRMPP
ncbi:MAG TPA: hypothetical protein VJT72_04510 [Pseudonocardiaceae bacterium]|nr:hypothetical protein [Pseudonocardiaceae bacterium]